MSGPWQNYGAPGATGPWQNYAQPQQPSQSGSGSGSVLPFSWDQGGVHFDPSAGIMGTVGRAVTLPGDVYAGKVDPLSNEGIGRTTDLATLATGTSPGAAWLRKPNVPVPTSAELKASGAAGRNAARGLGVEYDPQAIVSLAAKAQGDLLQKGFGPRVASKTNKILSDLQNVPDDPTATADFTTTIEAARANLQSVAQNFWKPKDSAAASQAIAALDELITRPAASDVVAGPAAALGETFTNANADYAAGSRSATLEAMAKRAYGRAAATGSGRNLDNTIRGKIDAFIAPTEKGGASAAERSGFSASEIDLLTKIRDGTVSTNRLRDLANMLGGGGGLGSLVTGIAGTALTGDARLSMLGLAPMATGVAAKMVENTIAKRALKDAAEEVRTRSATYGARDAAANPVPTNPMARAAMIRTLLLGLPKPQYDTTGKPIPAGTTIY